MCASAPPFTKPPSPWPEETNHDHPRRARRRAKRLPGGPHRKPQPAPFPAGRRRAHPGHLSAGRRPRRYPCLLGRPPVRTQRLPAHRRRQQRHRRRQASGNGPGDPHGPGHRTRRGTRCGLGAGQGGRRPGGCQALQQPAVGVRPGHRRQHRHGQFLGADAPRRGHGPRHAGGRRRAKVAGAGRRDHGRRRGGDATRPRAAAPPSANWRKRRRNSPCPQRSASSPRRNSSSSAGMSRARIRRKRSRAPPSSPKTCTCPACSPRWWPIRPASAPG